jgi:hypothetical protein
MWSGSRPARSTGTGFPNNGHDAYRRSGEARREGCRLDGEGQRRTISGLGRGVRSAGELVADQGERAIASSELLTNQQGGRPTSALDSRDVENLPQAAEIRLPNSLKSQR